MSAGALRSNDEHEQQRAAVVLAVAAADAGVSVPTSVRIEVAWDRRSEAHCHSTGQEALVVEVLTSDVEDVRTVLDALPSASTVEVRRL